ncbi:MAG: flagellar motor switch protein FliG [Sphingomonadaceae bacterium]|nr:flagellar motor switch protein FliG [Sphingomonadaceae bacterium]
MMNDPVLNDPVVPSPAIDGDRCAAILLMLLDDADASALLQHLDPVDVKSLGKAMFSASASTEADVELALDRFVSKNRTLSSLAVGAENRIQNMMQDALGEMRAGSIWPEIAPRQDLAHLDILKWMDIDAISELIEKEHPQVAAILLSALAPQMAALAIAGLDSSRQADLLIRTATLGDIPADAIRNIEEIVAAHLGRLTQEPAVKMGGEHDVAKIVNSLSRPQAENILKTMRKKDRALADAIEEGMFVFEDLGQLDAKALGAVLRMVDAEKLALAIKGASADLGRKMLGTLSARAAQTIGDEIAELGPVSRADIEEAQKAVTLIARSMAAAGEIMLNAGNDYV